MEIRVYVANLAKYNEGKLVGEWLTLPVDPDELREQIAKILGADEEYAIHDYEAPFEIHEYQDIYKLNETLQELADITEDEAVINLIFANLMFDEAMTTLRDGEYRVWNGCKSMEDVAYDSIEESGLLSGVPEELKRYFDYKAYGRDMDIQGSFFIDWTNEVVVEVW